jgi:hypothetical protein
MFHLINSIKTALFKIFYEFYLLLQLYSNIFLFYPLRYGGRAVTLNMKIQTLRNVE